MQSDVVSPAITTSITTLSRRSDDGVGRLPVGVRECVGGRDSVFFSDDHNAEGDSALNGDRLGLLLSCCDDAGDAAVGVRAVVAAAGDTRGALCDNGTGETGIVTCSCSCASDGDWAVMLCRVATTSAHSVVRVGWDGDSGVTD